MKSVLKYQISIDALPERVWEAMTNIDLYQKWASAFSPNSEFVGDWTQGEEMVFIDKDLGGTCAILDVVDKPSKIVARHTAMLSHDGLRRDTVSEAARNWIGSTETYTLQNVGGRTELSVQMETHPDFEKMMTDSWPQALELLKDLCEQ